jgi:hypothetical protein
MRFKFNDDKSRKQVNHFYTHRNCTRDQNASGLVQYQIKRALVANGNLLKAFRHDALLAFNSFHTKKESPQRWNWSRVSEAR